ncbi:MAG: aldehyde dehydrogenase family protein [Burkholderiaceae bacterium]|nr:aldehyde dehydrogenase family protein [Burkholderiaceae bacterium]
MSIPYTRIDSLYINGAWVRPESGQTDAVINPATEAVIGHAPVGGLAEADAAIAAARRAFDQGPWPRMSAEARATTMRAMHRALAERAEQIKTLMIAEGGVTRALAERMFYTRPMTLFEAAIARSLAPSVRHLPVETAPSPFIPQARLLGGGVVVREPLGVVAAITPYNAPFLTNLSKLVPALLAGNTVVLKPSPYTPYSALLFGEIASEIGLPPGVLNIITGDAAVARRITSDDAVDMVTFTGSEPVGAAILAQGAPTIKRTLLELGGKSALIVREDADIQKAAMEGLFQVATHCGQGCALATRHLVHNAVRPAYLQAMQAMVGMLAPGNPADPATMMGPLIRNVARERVERFVEQGVAEGARLAFGGTRPAHLERGYFYNVTMFDDVDNRMAIAQNEIFGPVGCVIGFDSDDEAVAIANDSRYGLYGGIHSRDPAMAYEMALQLRTGGVVINGGLYQLADAPFGGYKRSGLGREYGENWLHEYTQEKSILFPVGL